MEKAKAECAHVSGSGHGKFQEEKAINKKLTAPTNYDDKGSISFPLSVKDPSKPPDGSIEITKNDDSDKNVRTRPLSKSEAAEKLGDNALLSFSPVAVHFFCCVCGSPAGEDCFTCKNKGHPVCQLCQSELELTECPYFLQGRAKGIVLCGCSMMKFESSFRKFMIDNTIVSCNYRHEGCNVEGVWEEVKDHQKSCEHAGK